MKLILKDKYKSLEPFESDELNALTVITGKNGSGKTQLLDLLNKKFIQDKEVINIDISFLPEITTIQTEGLITMESPTINDQKWRKQVSGIFEKFKSTPPKTRELFRYIRDRGLTSKIAKTSNKQKQMSDDPAYLELVLGTYKEANPAYTHFTTNDMSQGRQNYVVQTLIKPIDKRLFEFVDKIIEETGKSEHELEINDFFNTTATEHLIDSNDLFLSKIELIFFNYAKRRYKNEIGFFRKERYSDENDSISDTDFTDKYPPPWKLINQIFDENRIDFNIKEISTSNFDPQNEIEIKLTKTSTGDNIAFNDLSSGEKIIIGLIVKLFSSEYYSENLKFPELLILDEPDAHLHPEMSKLLLDVLEKTFSDKFGIKIILTTHSPTTVALASENSIYRLTNGPQSSLKKITKDEALKTLTGLIPTLNIDYENHRQVFVESPTDTHYYGSIYGVYQQYNDLKYKLYFISNSYGKSNCEQVYKIVKDLRDSGNKTCYGIADWDLKNTAKNFTIVHGIDQRYSVENYILDPLYIVCLLINLEDAHGITAKIGVPKLYNEYSIGIETNEKLQHFTKVFFNEFERKFPALKYESPKKRIKYFNGKEIEIPEWYLKMKGHGTHGIVEKIKKVFPALEKYKNEGEIQKAVTQIIVKCYPFVPMDTIEILNKIGEKTAH